VPFERILLAKPSGRRGLSFAFDLIPIGLEYIAAYIEDAVEDVHIVDMEMEHRKLQDLIDLYSPDLAGFSLSATEHNEGLRLTKIAKKNGVTTVVGGYHPTSVPDLMLSYPQVDMVVRGEGEVTSKDLVEKGSPEGVLGVSYKKDGRIFHNGDRQLIEDLDKLPFPARHLRQYSYKTDNQKTGYDVLLTSRGCYGRCIFCCEPSMSNSHLRCRSPENVVEEVLEIAEYHEGKPVVAMIADPNFMGNPNRVDRICDLLMEYDLNIEFHALVRTDNMARHRETVKKMCDAGILYFEMGIESPNHKDLKSTKKGITTKVHREAVRNIRQNGGSAGGTFVIGLPDQTGEEVKYFPVYAKEIGMTAAAFGIATPFPGTEFHKELDSKGLMFETNWDNFDEMHSVYTTKHLSKEKIEDLATYCMGRFWNIDTFLDRERVFQRRTKRKTALMDFIIERAIDARFMGTSGSSLKKDEFSRHVRIFLEAYLDPRVEAYTRKVGVHNVLEMSRFLRILGPQTIQCTLNFDRDAAVSFVFKNTKKTVDYIRIIRGKQQYSTIDFDFDLKMFDDPSQKSKRKILKRLMFNNWTVERLCSIFRLSAALGTEFLAWKLSKFKTHKEPPRL
jgi:radical SAM superfamily enzyme YgiQ (UPF0313 family)